MSGAGCKPAPERESRPYKQLHRSNYRVLRQIGRLSASSGAGRFSDVPAQVGNALNNVAGGIHAQEKFHVTACRRSGAGRYRIARAATRAAHLDAIPEKMPFSNPYGAPSGRNVPSRLSRPPSGGHQEGLADEHRRGQLGANLVAFLRMDGAQLGSISIAQHKARAAVKFRRPTRAFEDAVQKFDFKYILTLDDVIASRGGIPLIEDGKIIGAIGCSGGTGSQDEAVCTAGGGLVNK